MPSIKEEILDLLAETDKQRYGKQRSLWLSEIARRVGHSHSTASRYLNELEEEGLVESNRYINYRRYWIKKGVFEDEG